MTAGNVQEMKTWNQQVSDVLGVVFVFAVLVFATQGLQQSFIDWVTPLMNPDWDELSRRAQRVAKKEGIFGGTFQFLKQNIYSKTGLQLGIPLTLSFMMVVMAEPDRGRTRVWNLTLAAVALVVFGFWAITVSYRDSQLIPNASTLDYIFSGVAIVLTLILSRRYFGWFITLFALFWLIYLFVKGLLPDWLPIFGQGAVNSGVWDNYSGMTFRIWIETGGIFGQPLQVVSRNVLVFIVFGAILISSGAGDLLLKIANRLTGGFVGGAAHAAVTSSALFGTLSGAAISNVVSTGMLTIPVIKKSGFKPSFAGAVEAAASTGGQVVPPVMGVVAFFVAAEVGIAYNIIMVAAIFPAVFYYLGVFLTVYFEARKQGIGPMPSEMIERLKAKDWVQSLVFVIPLTTLTYFLFTQPSISLAGSYGVVAAFICSFVLFKNYRSWTAIFHSLALAGKMSAQIIVIVALIGLIVGLMTYSGFAGRLALFITEIAGGAPLFAVLVVVAFGAIVLGMGLPPGATYFIIVIALSSGIKAIGVAPLTLHLFVVFFAVISTVTPPVALAAFAAAPIAGADPMRTGLQASRLSIMGFIIPFVFVFHPALLYKLLDTFNLVKEGARVNPAIVDPYTLSYGELGWILLALAVGIWLITSALIGFEKNKLFAWERLLRLGTGIALLVPNFAISLPALGIAVLLVVGHRFLGGEPSSIDVPSQSART